MTGRSRKYLSDILIAAGLIGEFLSDVPDFAGYQRDQKTKSAVERQLVIIGEAVNFFRKESGIELKNSHQIVNFRNRLVHASPPSVSLSRRRTSHEQEKHYIDNV